MVSLGMKEILSWQGVLGSSWYEITRYFVQGARFPFDLATPLQAPSIFKGDEKNHIAKWLNPVILVILKAQTN